MPLLKNRHNNPNDQSQNVPQPGSGAPAPAAPAASGGKPPGGAYADEYERYRSGKDQGKGQNPAAMEATQQGYGPQGHAGAPAMPQPSTAHAQGQGQTAAPVAGAPAPMGHTAQSPKGHGLTGRLEEAVGTVFSSNTLKTKGLLKQQEAIGLRLAAVERAEGGGVQRDGAPHVGQPHDAGGQPGIHPSGAPGAGPGAHDNTGRGGNAS